MNNKRGKEPTQAVKMKLCAITGGRCQLCNKFLFTEKTVTRVFNSIAEETRFEIENKKLKVDSNTGALSKEGDIGIRTTHHYGKVSKKKTDFNFWPIR